MILFNNNRLCRQRHASSRPSDTAARVVTNHIISRRSVQQPYLVPRQLLERNGLNVAVAQQCGHVGRQRGRTAAAMLVPPAVVLDIDDKVEHQARPLAQRALGGKLGGLGVHADDERLHGDSVGGAQLEADGLQGVHEKRDVAVREACLEVLQQAEDDITACRCMAEATVSQHHSVLLGLSHGAEVQTERLELRCKWCRKHRVQSAALHGWQIIGCTVGASGVHAERKVVECICQPTP